ncbi:hypothetical protein TRFO_35171 [Tritrichomonas foetus]|uniref:Uncharacterized protein n=1 Tax=Tritrichomonas foetus TaxID=1144522 RepID=A0A1J4JH11_9EUKA|nr:hypothetical protein TRFO_35171 [Tritrichomonas foetus]|eukprot:OHS98430.1 hypothetical protein TRFO_35171 [Tritrichomonas foetus]
MASEELSSAQMQHNLSVMSQRISNHKTNTADVMNAMNSIQKFLIPKHQTAYLPYLERIFEFLLLLCDDSDVSVRHTASVVLSSSVSVILPFQKSMILNFIANHCNKAFQPHALISMLDLELQVTLFLTQKVALQLFSESASLFNYCAKSSSEIVSEGLNMLAPRIRQFFVEKEKRVKLISNLAKPKDSVLATNWSIKTAAIFAYPDLIKVSLKFFSNPFNFLAAIQTDQLPNISFDSATLEELAPFVENDPPHFFNRLSTPPTNLRELSAYFSCLKSSIPYNLNFPVDILTDPRYKSDPVLFSLQLECFALMSLKGTFEHSKIFEVFRDAIFRKTACSVSALSIVFNCYPSVQLFEMAIRLPTSSPSMCKSLILFLTEIEFTRLIDSHKNLQKAIDKLTIISHSVHEMVHNTLIDRAPMFNCGKTYGLFQKIYSELDYFDPVGFRNSLTLLSILTKNECVSEINSLFINLREVDPSILYGDAVSLTFFLTVIRKICKNCKKIHIPTFINNLPLLVLRAIIALLNGEWSEHHPTNNHFNKLLEKTKANTLLVSVLSKQPLISLLEIRDKASACISAIRLHCRACDEKTLDLLGKKLISWPSKYNWLLISNSAKTLMTTTGGILSLDSKIALSSAIKNPEKFNPSMINGMTSLTAFAICNGFDVDFKLSVELVKAIDKIATDLPEKFVKKVRGSWLIVYFKNHLKHELVTEFKQKPYENWSGPKQFWNMLPTFLLRLHIDDPQWVCEFDRKKCDEFHIFFALRNIRYFSHEAFADYGEIDLQTKEDVKKKQIKLKPMAYYEPETLRGMRCLLYSSLHCKTFEKLCLLKRSVKNGSLIIKSVIEFLSSEDCGTDCFADAILLCAELSIAEQSEIDPLISPFLKLAPFRGFNFLYSQLMATKNSTTFAVPQINTINLLLESELKHIISILIKIGQPSLITLRPMSHINSYEVAKSIDQPFFTCSRYSIAPKYSESNENSLKKHIEKYGISIFAIDCIEKWINENEILQLINFVLNYVSAHGAYYTQKLAHVMGLAMSMHKNILPVVEAFVIVLVDSPFKKALEAEFKTAKTKKKSQKI